MNVINYIMTGVVTIAIIIVALMCVFGVVGILFLLGGKVITLFFKKSDDDPILLHVPLMVSVGFLSVILVTSCLYMIGRITEIVVNLF